MSDTEILTNMPRLSAAPQPTIYHASPVPGEVVEMISLLGEACARWPATTTSPPSDGDVGLLSDYSMICHVVARPDRIDEDMQTVGAMGIAVGVVLVLTVFLAWRIVGFLFGLARSVFRYYRQAEDNGVKSRKESDAAAVMLWSAQTTASRLRTMEGLRVDGPEVGQTIGQTPADSHGPEVTR